jgi:hypothetical protein
VSGVKVAGADATSGVSPEDVAAGGSADIGVSGENWVIEVKGVSASRGSALGAAVAVGAVTGPDGCSDCSPP